MENKYEDKVLKLIKLRKRMVFLISSITTLILTPVLLILILLEDTSARTLSFYVFFLIYIISIPFSSTSNMTKIKMIILIILNLMIILIPGNIEYLFVKHNLFDTNYLIDYVDYLIKYLKEFFLILIIPFVSNFLFIIISILELEYEKKLRV